MNASLPLSIVRTALAAVVLAAGMGHAAAQTSAATAGSAPSASPTAPDGPRATAPTRSTDRVLDAGRQEPLATKEQVATPQLAVPLRRSATDGDGISAVKPGKPRPAAGGVDDAAARCRAQGDRVPCNSPGIAAPPR